MMGRSVAIFMIKKALLDQISNIRSFSKIIIIAVSVRLPVLQYFFYIFI